MVSAGIGLAALTAAYFSQDKTSRPQREMPQVVDQRQQAQPGIQLELIASDMPGKFKGIGLRLDRAQQELFTMYAPVWYEVPEMNMTFPLPVEQGMSGFTTTFPQPESLDGKTFIIYGTDRAAQQRKVLYKMTIRHQ